MSPQHSSAGTTPPDQASLPYSPKSISADGLQLAVYDSGEPFPAAASDWHKQQPPLLLVHSMNAAASAFEWAPFVKRQARQRRVVALDLPGCGLSGKPDVAYTPQRMVTAISTVIEWMDATQIDMAALSLGCEFATQATLQQPHRIRSLALVSPTGMEQRRASEDYKDGQSRGFAGVRDFLRSGGIGRMAYRVMTTRLMIHLFMSRTWGTQAYDKRLLQHARLCAQRPGSRYVALDFMSGVQFTRGIIERYRALPVPVWVAHGQRGAFTDFGACPSTTGPDAQGQTYPVKIDSFDGGAMPQFEWPDAFNQAYRRFVWGLTPSSPLVRPDRVPRPHERERVANWGLTAS